MATQPVPMMRAPYHGHALLGVYRPQQSNFCPGCGQSNWYVGRQLAECARCDTALPLATTVMAAAGERTDWTVVRDVAS